MKSAYFDCFSGAAGDMIIGALLDAGLSFVEFKSEIAKLSLGGYKLKTEKVAKHHIAATKFDVVLTDEQPRRNPGDIIDLITRSDLDDNDKIQSIAIFTRLADAEARAHGQPADKVHFHEVGAVDAIIDICGAVIAFKLMGISKIFSSPLSLGTGQVETEHGIMPVPAPATVELVRNIPFRMTGVKAELTTPTGAAILTTLAEFAEPGIFKAQTVGYGAGSRDLPGLPNLIRVFIGESDAEFEYDSVVVMETNLDRTPPELLGAIFDELLSAGALDVLITPALMKKNRPGHLLTVLCPPDKKDKLAGVIFRRGMTLGIRVNTVSRMKLARGEQTVSTAGGDISVKIAEFDGRKIIFPEFDDMFRIMEKTGRSYDDILFQLQSELRKEK